MSLEEYHVLVVRGHNAIRHRVVKDWLDGNLGDRAFKEIFQIRKEGFLKQAEIV